ncbi:MAG TPA: hypothetical protein VF035_02565 [Longimicrobiales bacterium]
MVLLFALLCLIAIEVTTVGVHFVALQELRAGRAAARATQLRLAAQSAAGRALAGWPAAGLETLAIFDSMTVPSADAGAASGIESRAIIQRLATDLYLVRATARSTFRETAAVGALVALAPPEDLAGEAEAAVTAAGAVTVRTGASISAADACPESEPAAAVILPAADALSADGGTISGPVRVEAGAVGFDRMGSVTRAALERIAMPVLLPVISPSPTLQDGCATADPANWGDPAGAIAPCGSYLPILHRTGGLTVNGGTGQGILLVDGDLHVVGARFDGIIMVRGSVVLDSAAAVNGVMIVDGSITLERGARVDFDRCAVTESLLDVRVRGPFRPARRMWIPLF